MTSTLSILSADAALYDYKFSLTIKSTVREEQTWYNTKLITINYVKPPCEITQEEIDKLIGGKSRKFEAISGLTKDQKKIAGLVTKL